MESKNRRSIPDLARNRSSVIDNMVEPALDHAENAANIELSTNATTIATRPMIAKRSSATTDLLSVMQVAELLAVHEATIRTNCRKGKYPGAQKQFVNGGEGWFIPIASLPKAAQKAHAKRAAVELLKKVSVNKLAAVVPAIPDAEYALQWELFERKPGSVKDAAQKALDALLAYCELVDSGMPKEGAKKAIEASHGLARATLHRAISKTKKHPRRHWLPLLCPQWHGGRERAEYTPEAQAFILALRVRSPETNLRTLIRIAKKEGEGKGWVIPSEDTVAKRLGEESAWLTGGMKALERSFPVVERDYASLALHQCWESDGRRADVFCVWPDGTIAKPFVIVWRDVRTRYVLSIRICLNPDAEAVLGSFGSAMAKAQAIPATVKIDNGREYANKAFTGAQTTRYRFKPKVDEAIGILTAMGVVAKWSKPGQGRDKPIESWWNVIAEGCDKYPAFAGAYCGKNVVSKPEDFDIAKAIPLKSYAAQFINCVNEFHQRPHAGHGMSLRKPSDVYGELSATRTPNPPNESELRRCKMGVKSLKLDKKEATFKFRIDGHVPRRYWHEALSDLPLSMRDTRFNVHYEWDDPDAAVAVYSGDTFICDAMPIGRIDFLESDSEDVIAHMSAKGEFIKPRAKAISAIKASGKLALPDFSQMQESASLSMPDTVLVLPNKEPVKSSAPSPLHPISNDQDENARLAALKRKMEEARQARNTALMGVQQSPEELDEMQRKQREKSLQAYLR
jgi:putative transposase